MRMALRGRGRSLGMVPGLLRRVSGSAAPAAAAPPAAAPPAPVRVSLVVERNALVVPAPTPLEAAYGRYQERVADERSKPFVAEFFTKKTDTKAGAGAAADDNDPAAEDDAEDKVIYAPMATEADNAGNTTSMQRQLSRTLYFVVRGQQGLWQFPETQPDRAQPLLSEAGETFVKAAYGGRTAPKLFFAGHTPAAVFKSGSANDLPVFFFRSQLLGGDLAAADGHAWLTRDELRTALAPDYFKAVEPVLSP